MSLAHKNYVWLKECAEKLAEQNEKRKQILAALLINEVCKQKRSYRRKRFWIHPVFTKRRDHGFYHAIFPVIALEESRFRNYFRMTPTQFEDLLNIVAPFITKQAMVREPISATERLCLTLR